VGGCVKIQVVYNADGGWVISNWGNQIVKRLNKLDMSGETVNFYVLYRGIRGPRTGPLQVGLFTHNHNDGYFEKAAKWADWCICQAPQYEAYLRGIGITHVSTLPAPPDDEFNCKLNLAWIGHFYHPERKGIALFNKVRELDFVNLIYNEHATDLKKAADPREKIQAYYDACDYTLITSKFEGGPMCLVESLKCGKKVICPLNVGNAELFKAGIIPYENSNFDSLYAVLLRLYEEKKRIANIVKDLTWDNYVAHLVKILQDNLK
jgi:hypothetical protein